MPLRSINRRAHSLTGVTVAFLLVASSGHAQSASPLTKLSGSWSGSGSIVMASGAKESILCQSAYVIGDGARVATLQMELRCANNNTKFELQSDLQYDNGAISGMWSELTHGISGKMSGSIVGDRLRVVAESQVFQANIELTTRGAHQSIKIQSPGSEMSEILISLSRKSLTSRERTLVGVTGAK